MDARVDEPATMPQGAYAGSPSFELEEVASGLLFPEGPLALPDGSILVVEMCGGRITRIRPDAPPDRRIEVVAETGGGPNGLALGPDGAAATRSPAGIDPRRVVPAAARRVPHRLRRRRARSGRQAKPRADHS
jgi:hypothetical protein